MVPHIPHSVVWILTGFQVCERALSTLSTLSTGQMDAQDGVASNEPWIYGLEWHGKDGFQVSLLTSTAHPLSRKTSQVKGGVLHLSHLALSPSAAMISPLTTSTHRE